MMETSFFLVSTGPGQRCAMAPDEHFSLGKHMFTIQLAWFNAAEPAVHSASLSYPELRMLPIAAMMLLVIGSTEITEGSFRLTHVNKRQACLIKTEDSVCC